MNEPALSPWARSLADFIARWGTFKASAFIYSLVLGAALALACAYFYIATGDINWVQVFGVLVFAALGSPLFIYVFIYLIGHLESSLDFLESSSHQEKLLNQSLQENIRRLNFEIEERKKALQAKRQAVDELRNEIIERRQAQQELSEQGYLIRSILDSSPDLFYYRDENGKLAQCNKMFESLVGRPFDWLIGKTVEEIYPDNIAARVLISDLEVENKQSQITLDVEYETDSGEVLWFEMRKVPFYNRNGRYIGILAFGRDITARKRAEQALEQAFLDKGKFIATLSHELRTPLNGIVGLTRMLLDSGVNDQQRSWANTIFSSAETLGNIFNDLIDLDKVDRHELDIACESVNIAEFISDIVNFAGLISQQKGLRLDLQQQGNTDVFASIDPTRLRQVLWNLINNAVKFTKQGEIGVRFECQTAVAKPQLKIVVRDTGIGIAAAEQAKIFDMYYKVEDPNRSNALGSGIGLAVSKALVEAMGGKISVSSELGKGSEFTVFIPLELTEARQSEHSVQCRQLYILLVEDVPLNAEIATSLLEQRGHEVIVAENGEEALALIETEDDLDLILLDMQLPDMSGADIAREVRSHEHLAHIPIVALTANVRKAESELAGIEIQGALAKPLSTVKLDEMFVELFGATMVPNDEPSNKVKIEVVDDQLDILTINDFVQAMGTKGFTRGMTLFEKLYPGYIANMRQFLDSSALLELSEEAHKLKGAASSVGLLVAQQLSKWIELNAEQALVNESHLLELEQAIGVGLARLQQYVATLS